MFNRHNYYENETTVTKKTFDNNTTTPSSLTPRQPTRQPTRSRPRLNVKSRAKSNHQPTYKHQRYQHQKSTHQKSAHNDKAKYERSQRSKYVKSLHKHHVNHHQTQSRRTRNNDYKTSDYKTSDYKTSDHRTSDHRTSDHRTSNNKSNQQTSKKSQSSSYRPSTTSNYTTDSFIPPPSTKHQETPSYHIDHEVKRSVIPNLNLSTYGYSVNATDTTRQKALYDAVTKEGIDAVRNRIIWLLEKYADKDELVKILSSDFDWLDKYNMSTSLREKFDSQREHIKQKIHQRMQEKSKSRRRSLKEYHHH
jgi:hypothetical protein